MMRWLWFTIILLGTSIVLGQDPLLEQAIQVVRDWVGDPQAEVVYRGSQDYSFDLEGPTNCFFFRTGNYEITVDLDTMKVVDWGLLPDAYVNSAQTDQPMLTEDEIKNIALNYAQRHFPHWDEFPYWEFVSVEKFRVTNWDDSKEAWVYIIQLSPYFINDAGQKIPVLTTMIGVSVDPYSGNVKGFSCRHMPITLTSLNPSFSAEEAKTKIEQAFKQLGAAEATAVMSSPDDPYYFMPDGLVIGATQQSGLRLAYAFDYVVTVGAPGYEDEFGDSTSPAYWRAAIDAHTGELFYRQYYLGLSESDKPAEVESEIADFKNKNMQKGLLEILIGLSLLVAVLLIAKRKIAKLLIGARFLKS